MNFLEARVDSAGLRLGQVVVTLALPLCTMLSKSVRDADGMFAGLANYLEDFATPAPSCSILNSRGWPH